MLLNKSFGLRCLYAKLGTKFDSGHVQHYYVPFEWHFSIFQMATGDPTEYAFVKRVSSKFIENPLVVFGAGLSIYSAFKMAKSFRAKDALGFQYWQRARLVSSFGTIACILGGYYIHNSERIKSDLGHFSQDFKRWIGSNDK